MSLMFNASGILDRSKGLTFDDVLLMPCHSEMTSRLNPNLSSRITKRWSLDTPFVSANMDTVTEAQMALKMSLMGGLGVLHRFMTLEEQVQQVKYLYSHLSDSQPISASVGVKEEGKLRADHLIDAGVDIISIDIAHGDSVMLLEVLEYIKNKYPHIDVIAGNTSTYGGAYRMINAGADAIKVGIGPGSMCTTRIVTGCGVPQLTAIAICSAIASLHGVPVIADGGIKTSGDIVKAFAAGAQTVMLGSMFSGCLETPGELIEGKKKYRGMASRDAQETFKGGLTKGTSAEGVDTWVNYKGSVDVIIDDLLGGVRSGMTYLNAKTIQEIHDNALFMEMTSSGMSESKPHGLT